MNILDECGYDLLRTEWRLCKKELQISAQSILHYTKDRAYFGDLDDFDKARLKLAIDQQLKHTQDIEELALFIVTQIDDCALNLKPTQPPVPRSNKELSARAIQLWASLNNLAHDLGMLDIFEPTDWRPYRTRIFKPEDLEAIRMACLEYKEQLEQTAADWLPDDVSEPVEYPADWTESEKLPY